jgi:hypothetical protein
VTPRQSLQLLTILAIVIAVASPDVARAHPAMIAAANATFGRDGRVHITLTFDALAYALNDTPQRISNEPMDQLLDGPASELEAALADAKDRFEHSFAISADGKPIPISSMKFPGTADVTAWKRSAGSARLPVMLECSVDAQIPSATRSVVFRFPEVLGQLVLTVQRPRSEATSFALEAGMASPAVAIDLPQDGGKPTSSQPERFAAAARYVVFGFEHILPRGLDHILFVLGLFFLGTRMRPLLWQVTAFTVAHSLTLALSLYGVVRLPSSVVEPLIAASIAFVAVENLFTAELKPWRPLVVFGFGLVHGLGFAGVLTSAGLPRSEFVPALLCFNIGIELGQLTVIAAAMLLLGWFRSREWYRGAVVIPASLLIAAVGLAWMIQRIA